MNLRTVAYYGLAVVGVLFALRILLAMLMITWGDESAAASVLVYSLFIGGVLVLLSKVKTSTPEQA